MHLRRKLFETLWAQPIKPLLERIPLARRIYSGWDRRHPFDIALGIEASGYLPVDDCTDDPALLAQINPYGGSQPSIVRTVLAGLPRPEAYAFVDIGCGKGRPLVVASEKNHSCATNWTDIHKKAAPGLKQGMVGNMCVVPTVSPRLGSVAMTQVCE